MVGSTVNLASRLEHEAPPGGVLISYETFAHVKDEVECEERGRINVKGIAHPVATYGVAGLRSGPAPSPLRADMPHLRLEIDPQRMSQDERERAAEALRRALGAIERPANG